MARLKTQSEIIEMVKQYRYDHELSRPVFAALADLDDGTLASFESRRSYPSLVTAVKLAGAMGISMDEFVLTEVQHEQ